MKRLLPLLLCLFLLLCGCDTSQLPQPSTDPDVTGGESLSVHFIDVGQADCTLLECAGQYMLIDGGNVEDSSLVVSYLEQQGVEQLEIVVCSHAHEDHVGGLPAVLAVFPTDTIYAPTKTYSSSVFDDFIYYADQQGLDITIPAPSDAFDLGTTRITVLGPVKSYPDPNNTSIILRVEFGTTSFLFTGDMETDAETDMLDYWGDLTDWQTDVLKIGHHGSSTSTGYRFLYETAPDYAVISVGKDNSYGHPHIETIDILNDAAIPTFRTDELGTILAVSDGSEIAFTWKNQNAEPTNTEQTDGELHSVTYIGNKNSKKLHLPICTGLPSEENQVIFSNYDLAIAEGYQPCSRCMG